MTSVVGTGAVRRDAVVADARRRADRHRRRSSTCSSICGAIATSRRSGGCCLRSRCTSSRCSTLTARNDFERRNAQSIDINRDALRLQTPEGRLLKALRDRLQPDDRLQPAQSELADVGRRSAEARIDLAAVCRLRPAAQRERRARADQESCCAVIRDALEPFAAGQIGRYDDEFEVRAFGDNLTLWGTPVVLIETGAWPAAEADLPLVRLNFIALVSALDALATGRVDAADPSATNRCR